MARILLFLICNTKLSVPPHPNPSHGPILAYTFPHGLRLPHVPKIFLQSLFVSDGTLCVFVGGAAELLCISCAIQDSPGVSPAELYYLQHVRSCAAQARQVPSGL